jgi:hypothetical protein
MSRAPFVSMSFAFSINATKNFTGSRAGANFHEPSYWPAAKDGGDQLVRPNSLRPIPVA